MAKSRVIVIFPPKCIPSVHAVLSITVNNVAITAYDVSFYSYTIVESCEVLHGLTFSQTDFSNLRVTPFTCHTEHNIVIKSWQIKFKTCEIGIYRHCVLLPSHPL
jgi:hypothetical protein